jgi:hypothetical protein
MSNDMLSRVRRNHALEHATIHVLTERNKGFSAQGNSTPKGFNLNIYGQLEDDEVSAAVEDAFRRLKEGEKRLAVHPNCGTVLLTMASLATFSALAAFGIEQKRLKRSTLNLATIIGALPTTIMAVLISLIVAKPIGIFLQERYTVEGDLGNLQVVSIQKVQPSLITRLFQLLLGQARNNDVQAYRIETVD